MDLMHPEFVSFIKCANQNNLRYLLIGGFAVNYYGFNRNTQDLDIWIAPSEENKHYFIKTLTCLGYSQNEVEPLYAEDFTKPFVADIGLPDAGIDILTIVHHKIDFDEAEKQKETFLIEEGVTINIVPLQYLKEMKLYARREKDLWDIARLDEILKNKK